MGDPRRNRKKEGRRGTKPPPSPSVEELDDPVRLDEEAESDVQDDKFVSLEKERDDLLDKFQRLAAEFDNYRKRQARDFNRLIDQGRKKLVEELLTVLDNFDRAKVTCEGDHSDKEIVDGILQTYEQLQRVLKKEGLEEIPIEPGDPFDPNIHEAMVAESIDEGETDIVLEVFQKGYYFGQNLLRPARVKVGKVSPRDGVDIS